MKSLLIVLALAGPALLCAQHITYSDPEPADGRRTNFEIIGKINGNVMIFKNNHSQNEVCVYDNEMKLVSQKLLDFVPDNYINVDFLQFHDFCYMFYEYQKKNVVHCTAVKLDALGNKVGDPVDLDTTHVGLAASNKIYTVVFSEDKHYIMAFKINSKNPKNYLFTTYLYDNSLELVDRHRLWLPMDERNDLFTNFLLDNSGKLVFGRFFKNSSSNYISKIFLVTKGMKEDSFAIQDIGTNDRALDDIKIKVDNNNKRYILTGFYYKQKKGNIEGLYVAIWDEPTDKKVKENVTLFNDELRGLAKSSEANLKMAFNDFFIKSIIVEKDGGYLIVSESEYTTSRGGLFNRWDYLYGYNSLASPVDYYGSPYYSPYGYNNPYRYGNNQLTRFNSENIMVMSFDRDGNLEWSNVIPKNQYDDESENLISHHTMNTGGELHFLYNQYERRTMLLNDQSISPDGKLTRNPTLRNLDKGYDFMPRHGKQISSNQIVIPCMYRNYLCFAKIDF